VAGCSHSMGGGAGSALGQSAAPHVRGLPLFKLRCGIPSLLVSFMPLSLNGRRVVVLGVGTGMGRSIALALSSLGAKVILGSRSLERLRSICAEASKYGGDCHPYQVDVTRSDELQLLSQKVESEHGGATDLVYNAGGFFSLDPIQRVSEELFDSAYALNAKGFFLAVKAFLEQVQRASGSIVAIIASPATILAGSVAYAASKGAMEWMVRRLAKELAGSGVRVNCVAPGPTSHEPAPIEPGAARLRSWEQHPPSDVGWAVAILVSGALPRMTGECLVIDGGLSLP